MLQNETLYLTKACFFYEKKLGIFAEPISALAQKD